MYCKYIQYFWGFDPVSSLSAKDNNDINKQICFISISHYDKKLNCKGDSETYPKMFWISFCFITSLACLAFKVVEIDDLIVFSTIANLVYTLLVGSATPSSTFYIPLTSPTSVWILSGPSWWPTRRNGRAEVSSC